MLKHALQQEKNYPELKVEEKKEVPIEVKSDGSNNSPRGKKR